MKKQTSFMKSVGVKALLIGSCFTMLASGSAYAGSVEPAPSAVIQIEEGYGSETLREKHQEIDKFLFEENGGEFAEQGFKITHTGPMNGFIEIGITPYDDAGADFLYEKFGSELVKVVEGQQAVTLALPAAAADDPVRDVQQQNASAGEGKAATLSVTGESGEAAETVVHTTAMEEPAAAAGSSNNIWIALIVFIAAIVLGGAAYTARRLGARREA
ncbi:hypothetical protein AB6A23_06350 [Paenibacillus tarimensis]